MEEKYKNRMQELKKISEKVVTLLEENNLNATERKAVLELAKIEVDFISTAPTNMKIGF